MQIIDSTKWFDQMFEEAKTHDEFLFEGARIRISEAICRKMKTLNIDETTLAEMVGCKKQSIARIMTGTSSFNFKLLCRIGKVLKLELSFVDVN